jgi:putative spermidine/putrescine transport system permease protein
MVIMLGGRQGLIPNITNALFGERLVFAYSMVGLFIGYIYFSIPRTILTVIAAAEKLDPQLVEAARSLGASNWRVLLDVLIPGLQPALLAAGAICFATSMGAFGTAFTLATKIDVLPMVIYTEFTLQANIAMAAALSFVLGLLTWSALAFARSLTGNAVAAAA